MTALADSPSDLGRLDTVRFCPRCASFYPDSTLRYCSRDGVALDHVDRTHDTGESLTGRVLEGKFILKRQLGRGGMGAVYLAVQRPMGREVAVKVIYSHLANDPRMVERALREAEAANQVDHPNVVTIYDSGRTSDGLVYIAMECLRGEDLAQVLAQRGPLPPDVALPLWLQAVRAMASAHNKGVVHRDLKPDNLFLARRRNDEGPSPREEQVVKIVDFGIAKLLGPTIQKTSSGGLLGTLRYMSPEQLHGQEAGPQADVYALALILVQMLTGQLPWPMPSAEIALSATLPSQAAPADTAMDVQAGGVGESLAGAFRRLVQPPTPLAQLRPEQAFSVELQALLDRMLALDPSARPRDAGEVLAEVASVPEAAPGLPQGQPGEAPLSAAPLEDGICPFPGLLSFDEGQARFFCGREEEVRQALGRLGDTPAGHRRWLQIEGASGAGKSSLARAGLVPAIRRGQLVGQGVPPPRCVATLRPGRDPIAHLAQALAAALTEAARGEEGGAARGRLTAAEVDFRLREGEGGLLQLLLEQVPAGQSIFLLVDQLEEALVLAGEDLRALLPFDGLLAHALSGPDTPLYLITTIRSDLVGRFQELPRLEAKLNDASRYYLRPMSEEGLRQAILEPARLFGLWWEPGLVERIVADARQAEGSLPLLGHALRALWEQRQGRRLTSKSYEALGGVAGALTRGADALLEGMGEAGRERARRLLLSLVKIGRGSPDTRQALSREAALHVLAGDGAGVAAAAHRPAVEAEALLLRLSGGKDPLAPEDAPPPPRLLVIYGDEGGEGRVDLVHEALLKGWQTLRRWIDEDRKMLERRDDLEATAQVWEATGYRQDGLPHGGLLAYYQGAGLTERQQASLHAQCSARALRFLSEAREVERRAERDRRRRGRRALSALLGGVLLTSALSGYALLERSRARRQQGTAEARLREAVAGANRVVDVLDRELRPIAGTAEVRRSLVEAVSMLQDHLLAGAGDNPAVLRSRMASHVQRGDVARTHEDTLQAQREFQAAVDIGKRLLQLDRRSRTHRLELARAYRHLGDVRYESRQVEPTKEAYDQDLALTQALAEEAPEDPRYRLELALALSRSGNVQARVGQHSKAAQTYLQARQMLLGLKEKDPEDREVRHALAMVAERRGDALTRAGTFRDARAALHEGLALGQALVEEEPRNAEYRRTLGVTHTRLGALALEAGNLAEAEASYEQARQAYQLLLDADPRSVPYRQALASVHRAMGDVAQRTGALDRARAAYQRCLALRQALSAGDPGNAAYRQGISTIYGALGDLERKAGRLDQAQAAYEQALALRKGVAEADPRNAYSRQRLAAAYLALGEVAERRGRPAEARGHYLQALGLRKDLLAQDPQGARARQEVAVAYSRLGGVAAALQDRAEAGRDHDEALRLLRELTAAYPNNVLYRQDLAQAYGRLGDTARLAGDLPGARRAYEEELRLRQELARSDPKNAEWQRDLLRSHLDLAQALRGTPGGQGRMRRELEAARGILRQLVSAGLLSGDQELAEAKEALARF
jgi:serine/threonine protein kinase/tetratricopeptide (TPR) repeat protein